MYIRIWLLGATLLFAVHGLYCALFHYYIMRGSYAGIYNLLAMIILYSPWIASVVASLLASYYANKYKLAVGISLTVPSVIALIIANNILELMGYVGDFSGPGGWKIIAMISTPWTLFLCSVGSIAGVALSKEIRK